MIIDGKKIAADILKEVKDGIAGLSFHPKLIDVLVGADPVTESYVNIKAKRALEAGIEFEAIRFPEDISQDELEKAVHVLNIQPNLRGLIIQLPLPAHLNKQSVVDRIDPSIDVDVITAHNLGKMFTGTSPFVPATAASVMRILQSVGIDQAALASKRVLIIGSGDLVGKPVAFLLMQSQATVTIANHATKNLKELCLQAEIIISGTGQPKLVTADMVSAGAIVIDAGTAESAGGISGDTDFEALKDLAGAITPVPGGVGPVTVAMLLYNVLQAAKARP